MINDSCSDWNATRFSTRSSIIGCSSAKRSSTMRLTSFSWSASWPISSSKYCEANALARFCRSVFSIAGAKVRQKVLGSANKIFQKAKNDHAICYKMPKIGGLGGF